MTMKVFIKDTLRFPFLNKNRFIGAVIGYFVIVGLLYSGDWILSSIESYRTTQQIAELNEQPASEWIEYFTITPQRASFSMNEPIDMRSESVRKRSAAITWNDILYCDKTGDNNFTRIDAFLDSRVIQVDEVEFLSSAWTYGDVTLQRPHDPVVTCYILSEQTVCPLDARIDCKHQEIRSVQFLLTNP